MPRLNQAVPKYRKHRASGQALVTLCGRDHYLGPHGTKTSHLEYDRLIGEWLAAGRRATTPHDSADQTTVVELVAAFWRHVQVHYMKNGRPTAERASMKTVLRYLRDFYGHTLTADFRPVSLEAIRNKMIAAGNARGYINQNTSRIKHIFKWGVAQELVPESTYRRLATVAGLLEGKCDARESEPVLPVADTSIDATLPYLPATVADMVRIQRATGMRPGEVVLMRPSDVNRIGSVWEYRPVEHKMQHKKRGRLILLGPLAQAVVLPYLARDANSFCFVPTQASKDGRYCTRSYRNAVHRACELAWIPDWNVNQIRHTAATEIRSRFGLDAAQAILGHAKADTTQIYAEKDMKRAAEIMRSIG